MNIGDEKRGGSQQILLNGNRVRVDISSPFKPESDVNNETIVTSISCLRLIVYLQGPDRLTMTMADGPKARISYHMIDNMRN